MKIIMYRWTTMIIIVHVVNQLSTETT
jgi:hypothetical protein